MLMVYNAMTDEGFAQKSNNFSGKKLKMNPLHLQRMSKCRVVDTK